MSEFERQTAIFADKVPNPDEVINACSVMKAEFDDGDVYYFLTDDDKIVKITTRESER